MMPNKQNTKKKNKKTKNGKGSKGRENARRAIPMAYVSKPSMAQFRVNGKTGFRVTHTEMVDTVDAAVLFADGLIGYRMNPGNANLFPWLSNLANCFEKYRFTRLVFKYVPHCPVSINGALTMGVDYDACDALPPDRPTLLAFKTRATSSPYEPVTMVCAATDLKSTVDYRYVLTANMMSPESVVYPPNSDRRLYDMGYVYVSMESSGGANLGDFWVEYEVEFIQPDFVQPTASSCVLTAHSTVSVTKTDPLGSFIVDWMGSAYKGITKLASPVASLLGIPRGLSNFMIDMTLGGTNVTGTTARVTDSNGAERKDWGTITLDRHVGDGGPYQTLLWSVLLNPPYGEQAYLAFESSASTAVNSLWDFMMFPKAPAPP